MASGRIAIDDLVVLSFATAAQRVVLAKREGGEVSPGQDAAQIRVPGELDPEHVVRFSLTPFGARPEVADRGDAKARILIVSGGVALRIKEGLDDKQVVAGKASEDPDHGESAGHGSWVVQVVHRGDIAQKCVVAFGVFAEKAKHRVSVAGFDDQGCLPAELGGLELRVREGITNSPEGWMIDRRSHAVHCRESGSLCVRG